MYHSNSVEQHKFQSTCEFDQFLNTNNKNWLEIISTIGGKLNNKLVNGDFGNNNIFRGR